MLQIALKITWKNKSSTPPAPHTNLQLNRQEMKQGVVLDYITEFFKIQI